MSRRKKKLRGQPFGISRASVSHYGDRVAIHLGDLLLWCAGAFNEPVSDDLQALYNSVPDASKISSLSPIKADK